MNAAEGDWVASVNVNKEELGENGESRNNEENDNTEFNAGIAYYGILCNDMATVDISLFFKVSNACSTSHSYSHK